MIKQTLLAISCFTASININAQTATDLYGFTSKGGDYGVGTVFKTDASGNNFTSLASFTTSYVGNGNSNYVHNTKLCLANNGMYYGINGSGGKYDFGTIFKYDPINNTYTHLIDFDGPNNGRAPKASLYKASNGKLYGTTTTGGSNDAGVLFEIDPSTDTYTKKLNLGLGVAGALNYNTFVEATDGLLYAVTATSFGNLFSYNIATNTTSLIATSVGSRGALIQATNGKLYGVVSTGGSSSNGFIYEYVIGSTSVTPVYNFSTTTGYNCQSGLTEGAPNVLYGLNVSGAANSKGNVFSLDVTTLTYTNLFDLSTTFGYNPYGGFIKYNNKLYAALNGASALIEVDLSNNAVTKKATGVFPLMYFSGNLSESTNGKLYGIAPSGGNFTSGVLYEFDVATNSLTSKINMEQSFFSTPNDNLCKANNGKFYALTFKGSASGFSYGTIIQFDPITNVISNVTDLTSLTGYYPIASSFMSASNGKLYALIYAGGANNSGTIIEFDPTTLSVTKKQDLSSTIGSSPRGSFVEHNNKLYATCSSGGANNAGTIIEYDYVNNVLTKKYDFIPSNDGSTPKCDLTMAPNGNFYGATITGGPGGAGVIFEYDPATSTYTKKTDLSSTFGSVAHSLLAHSNGQIYGHTNASAGIRLFTYDTNTSAVYSQTNIISSTNIGGNHVGRLIESTNGNIYFLGSKEGTGSTYNFGSIVEYNPITNAIIQKHAFNGADGNMPTGGLTKNALITTGINSNKDDSKISVFPNPTSGIINIELDVLNNNTLVELRNALGQIVFSTPLNQLQLTINIGHLPSAVYFLKIRNKTMKIVKE